MKRHKYIFCLFSSTKPHTEKPEHTSVTPGKGKNAVKFRLLIVRDFLVLYEILASIREYEKDFQKTIKIRDFRLLPNNKVIFEKNSARFARAS